MSKVIDRNLDGYWMYEAPRLDVTSKDFKANVEQVVSALVQVRDESRETYRSPVGDSDRGSSQWCPASPYYAPTDASSTSCYGNRSETINSSDQTPPCASAEAGRQESVDGSVVTKWRPPWAKSVERTWKERSAEASAPKVRRAAQHAQSQEIEAATDASIRRNSRKR